MLQKPEKLTYLKKSELNEDEVKIYNELMNNYAEKAIQEVYDFLDMTLINQKIKVRPIELFIKNQSTWHANSMFKRAEGLTQAHLYFKKFIENTVLSDNIKVKVISKLQNFTNGKNQMDFPYFHDLESARMKMMWYAPEYMIDYLIHNKDIEGLRLVVVRASKSLYTWHRFRNAKAHDDIEFMEKYMLIRPKLALLHFGTGFSKDTKKKMSPEFYLEAVKHNASISEYLPQEIYTQELVEAILERSSSCIRYVPLDLVPEELMVKTIARAPSTMMLLPLNKQTSRLIFKANLLNPKVFKYQKKFKSVST